MQWQVVVVLVVAILVILFPAAYVWYNNIGGMYAAIQERRKKLAKIEQKSGRAKTTISTGQQIRRALPIALPTGITAVYGFLIWLFLAIWGWQFALAIGLALPVLSVPVLFIWYLNVSGVYQVIRDRMHRQRMRAEAVKEAEEILRREKVATISAQVSTEKSEEKVPGSSS